MCAIAGYYNVNSSFSDIDSTIDTMNKSQDHRGPDGSGKFINSQKNFGMKMSRLSILDLKFGAQPMHSIDGRYTIVFNGTILNSPTLRKELENNNIKFFSNNSDTEVLLNILIKYKHEGIKYLNGSFAFAFYDKKEQKLICGRDRFGIAPFYYLYKNDKFLFASELKSILKTGHSDKKLDRQNLFHYFSLLWSPGPNTIIEDIKKLSPGHFLEINFIKQNLKIQKWHIIKFEPDHTKSINSWKEEISNALENSVERATLSDVPISCGLSGGLDSQVITGILSKKRKVSTFNLHYQGYENGPLNELQASRLAANYFQTKHHEIKINQEHYFEDLDKMIFHLDEPYGGSLPLWHVFKEAGKNHTVFISGIGGDELFGNYGRWTVLEKFGFNIFKNYKLFQKIFFNRKYFFSDDLKKNLLITEKNKIQDTCEFVYNRLNKFKSKNIRDKIYNLDLKNQMPDEFCNMVDKFAYANKLEVRAPFLDNELTDLIQKIPSEIRTNNKDFKYLLRLVAEDIIPKENLNNQKRGFVGLESQQISHNFNHIKNELFSETKIKRQQIFDYNFLSTLLSDFEKQGNFKFGYNLLKKRTYNYKSLWSIIMFQKWYDIFLN